MGWLTRSAARADVLPRPNSRDAPCLADARVLRRACRCSQRAHRPVSDDRLRQPHLSPNEQLLRPHEGPVVVLVFAYGTPWSESHMVAETSRMAHLNTIESKVLAGVCQSDADNDDANAAEVPAEDLLLGGRQVAVRARKAKVKISMRVAPQDNVNDRKMLLLIFFACCGAFDTSRVG